VSITLNIRTLTQVVPAGVSQLLLESGENSPWVEVSGDGDDNLSQGTCASADYELIMEPRFSERYQFT